MDYDRMFDATPKSSDEQNVNSPSNYGSTDAKAQPGADAARRDGILSRTMEGQSGTAAAGEAASVPPGEYKLDVPDGMFNDEQIASIESRFHELGLSQDVAQKLIELSASEQRLLQDAHSEQVKIWEQEVRADREMGGKRFEATVAEASAGLRTFDSSGEILAMLSQTGYQNHPAVIRFLSRVGRAHAEHSLINGRTARKELPLWERLYPNS